MLRNKTDTTGSIVCCVVDVRSNELALIFLIIFSISLDYFVTTLNCDIYWPWSAFVQLVLRVPSCKQSCGESCCQEHYGDVFLDDAVLWQSTSGSADDESTVGVPAGRCDFANSGDSASKPSSKAVVFSLRNQVGGLVRALRVFKARNL